MWPCMASVSWRQRYRPSADRYYNELAGSRRRHLPIDRRCAPVQFSAVQALCADGYARGFGSVLQGIPHQVEQDLTEPQFIYLDTQVTRNAHFYLSLFTHNDW